MIVEKVEDKLARLMNMKHFSLFGHARNGLYLLIKALQWDRDAEVIIPAFTCAIVPFCIEKAGAKPVPVDSEPSGLNIDPVEIRKAITERTKAVYVIHTYGTAAKIEEICAIAKVNNLIVIEDLAHALFARHKRKQLGTFGDFAVLSLTKKILNFEGGAIGTNNTDIHQKILSLQKEYSKHRFFTINSFMNSCLRMLGAMWERNFSLCSLINFKALDLINIMLYRGKYGLKVDRKKFHMHEFTKNILLKQLDYLYEINQKDRVGHLSFREKSNHRLTVPEENRNPNDSIPLYNVGMVEKGRMLKLFSFRTWRNCQTIGVFPRADYLYSNLRIFSKIVKYL